MQISIWFGDLLQPVSHNKSWEMRSQVSLASDHCCKESEIKVNQKSRNKLVNLKKKDLELTRQKNYDGEKKPLRQFRMLMFDELRLRWIK